MAKKKDTSKSAAPERRANTADMVQSEVVTLSSITPNKGQIPGVPKNQMKPGMRFIRLSKPYPS